jgi:diaminohydroxyphosphoribosylaminopyrimidine deaminase / 5-amino-6-(5-phosphoribosylamino)uracil reductase
MDLEFDEFCMRRALDLAMKGRGRAEPNPLVGCVIARGGAVLSEGYHEQFGGPHAERNAIDLCNESMQGATACVTLEPCCHTRKKTPPCVPAIVKAGISRVLVACIDPNPLVSGKGITLLRKSGISVETGLLESSARQLNAPFFARVLYARPYITLKWAQTADGKVAGPNGARLQITSPEATAKVHRLRANSDAVLVGINTVLKDDPLLTARDIEKDHHKRPLTTRPLIRAVVDTHLRLPLDSKLVKTSREMPAIVYTGELELAHYPDRAAALRSAGVHIVSIPTDRRESLSLTHILRDLHSREVTHLLVEGGPTLTQAFVDQRLADRVWLFQASVVVDSPTAPSAPHAPYTIVAERQIGPDQLVERLNEQSNVFFAAIPSADFKL